MWNTRGGGRGECDSNNSTYTNFSALFQTQAGVQNCLKMKGSNRGNSSSSCHGLNIMKVYHFTRQQQYIPWDCLFSLSLTKSFFCYPTFTKPFYRTLSSMSFPNFSSLKPVCFHTSFFCLVDPNERTVIYTSKKFPQ